MTMVIKTLFSSAIQRESFCQHLSVIHGEGNSMEQLLLFALPAESVRPGLGTKPH